MSEVGGQLWYPQEFRVDCKGAGPPWGGRPGQGTVLSVLERTGGGRVQSDGFFDAACAPGAAR